MTFHVTNQDVEMTPRSNCASASVDPNNDIAWQRALWIVLGVNVAKFVAEMVAGGSKTMQADAIGLYVLAFPTRAV